MKALYNKKFLTDLARIPVSHRVIIESFVFEELPKAKAPSELRKIEKMRGYKNSYKARFGDYRVGFRLTHDSIVCERVLHRKEIYRFFP